MFPRRYGVDPDLPEHVVLTRGLPGPGVQRVLGKDAEPEPGAALVRPSGYLA